MAAPTTTPQAPPSSQVRAVAWVRQNLFNGVGNSVVTVVILLFLAMLLPALWRWAVADAVLTLKPSAGSLRDCP